MPKKILYGEDEPGISDAIKMLLAQAGYEVRHCDNGRDIIPAIDSFKPDLLVMDLMMPGIDGVAIVRQLNADPEKSRLPVIICSALPNGQALVEEFLQVQQVVVKPFTAAILLDAIRSALAKPPIAPPAPPSPPEAA